MSLIEDALLVKLMEANTPFMIVPSGHIKKKKKTQQQQFNEEFRSMHEVETPTTRMIPSPTQG